MSVFYDGDEDDEYEGNVIISLMSVFYDGDEDDEYEGSVIISLIICLFSVGR